jgi:quercetin dioxygenase-like cupin family protein
MTDLIRRRADQRRFTLTPSDTMHFVFEGGDESPDFMDETFGPGDGPPLHRHPWMTWELVVSGRVLVMIGDDTWEAAAGDAVFTPPDVPHTFMAIGDSAARVVGINWPGGFHRMYAEFESIVAEQGALDPGAMAAAAQRHGAEILGPPLAVLRGAD